MPSLLRPLAGAPKKIESWRRDQTIQHPRRQALHDLVRAHPGASFRMLVRSSGIPAGTARHRLNILLRVGIIAEAKTDGAALTFYGVRMLASERAVARPAGDPSLQAAYDLVQALGRCKQREVLDAAPWPRSSTHIASEGWWRGDWLMSRPVGGACCTKLPNDDRFPPRVGRLSGTMFS